MAVEDEAQDPRNETAQDAQTDSDESSLSQDQESQDAPEEGGCNANLAHAALRDEIAQLRENNAVIWDELLSLRAVLEKQAKLLHEITAIRKPCIYLPPEILHQIFLRATPPPFVFDASITPGPQSPWCRSMSTKKSIVRVCRSWYTVGIGLLYEDVVFRRISQIPAFLRTLEASPDTFCELTLGITLYALIDSCFVKSFNEQMQRIFELCPRLCRFAFTSPECLPSPAALLAVRPSITRFEFNDLFKSRIIYEQISKYVVGLSTHANGLGLDFIEGPSLCFPKLEELTIRITPDSGPILINLSWAWSLPSLRRLSFVLEWGKPGWLGHDLVPLEKFCVAHGHLLKFLEFHPIYVCNARHTRYRPLPIQPLLDACPVLEHLVLFSRVSSFVKHRTIKWVDVWVGHYSEKESMDLHTSLNNEMFPQLQGVRHIAFALSFLPSIPTLMHPSMVLADQDAFEWDYPGFTIRHLPGYISGGRTIDIDSEEYGYDDDSDDSEDESYVPPNGGDTSDASSLSADSEMSHTYNDPGDDEDLWFEEFSDTG